MISTAKKKKLMHNKLLYKEIKESLKKISYCKFL